MVAPGGTADSINKFVMWRYRARSVQSVYKHSGSVYYSVTRTTTNSASVSEREFRLFCVIINKNLRPDHCLYRSAMLLSTGITVKIFEDSLTAPIRVLISSCYVFD